MNAMELLTGPLAQAIGWALLHLLWQATIVAGILAAVLALMSRQTANARYVVSCGALFLVFAMFVATAVRAYDPAAAPIAIDASSTQETVQISLAQIPVLLAETAAEGLRDRTLAAASAARNAFPSIVALWLAGVVFLSARLLVSWRTARRLAHRGAQPAEAAWQTIAARLSNSMGLTRAVTLLQSAAVEVPSVIGTLRPIILLPASTLTGLTPSQIEMVLAHELAHIRRHDFLANLLQAVAETLMFYHPAVWWMSRRVRIERENCCDDLAVAVCGNPIQYARALTRLEELRANAPSLVVAANGGSLLDRIRRIAAGSPEGTSSSPRWAAAVAMLSIVVLAVAIPSLPALAQRDDAKPAKAEPATASVEVVEPAEVDPIVEEIEATPDSDHEMEMAAALADIDPDLIDLESIETPEAPRAPRSPAWPMAAIAPPAPAPYPSPRAWPVAAIAPTPSVTPTPSVPPVAFAPPALAAMMEARGRDHDFDFDFEHDNGGEGDRELGAGGKLSVDELIALRASGVTPSYVNTMREHFPGLTLRQVRNLGAVGVTTEFLRDMRAAGFDVKSANEASSLRAVGVTPEYVKKMRAAGFEIKTARDASSLRAVGVTPEYVQQMRTAGFEIKTARDASNLRAVGVTPEYVKEMRAAGFEIKTARDASSLRAVGVTSEWVRELRAAGVKIESAKEASNLRAVGVTAEFVKRLAKAGYANLTVRELSRLAAVGVDEDFISDMEQYRKKN